MKKKTLGIIIVSVLGTAAIFCSAMFTHQYLDAKNSKSAFDDLTNLITEIDKPQKATEAEESGLNAEELAAAEAALAHEKYDALFEQNNDFIGWIKIEGTNVNYPVMQTPNKPDFYLKRSFDKTYSDCGVPYIDEACMTGISNNLVIYGHHMNDGSMFADLCKYTDADFYKEHPTIAFDTLSGLGKYEVVAAFKFNTNRETFKYNEYTLMDEVQFAEFMENVRARQLYDTGVTAELVSGNRRKRACELAGFDTLRCEVVDLDRDAATILMVESNFQRSQILPSEKAFAYKMRLEAMKRQAGRPSKENASPLATNKKEGF